MKNGKEILSSLLKTTQMGQLGIRSCLGASTRPELRKALDMEALWQIVDGKGGDR